MITEIVCYNCDIRILERMRTMEQNTIIEDLTVDNSKNNNAKWKIITIITSVLAICGIVFSVCAMVYISQQDQQIHFLMSQLEECGLVDIEECGLVDTDASDQDTVPDGYVAVFHGGVGERTYQTYIYKDDNDQANYGFSYINTVSTTKSYGSPDWNEVVTGHGVFNWTDEAFTIAEENGAYQYVTIPGSREAYSIEDFKKMFLMN